MNVFVTRCREVLLTLTLTLAGCVGSERSPGEPSPSSLQNDASVRGAPESTASVTPARVDCAGCVKVSHPTLGDAGCLRVEGQPPDLPVTSTPLGTPSCDPACCAKRERTPPRPRG